MTILEYAVFLIFPLVMIYAAISDLTTMTISNTVSLILLGAFFIAAPLLPGMNIETFGLHLAAGATVLIGGFALFSFGWIGGGDAKIAAAGALWLGFGHTIEYMVWTALLGGVLTLLILRARRRFLPEFAMRREWIARLHEPSGGVPYGIALGAAALLIYPQTSWIALAGG